MSERQQNFTLKLLWFHITSVAGTREAFPDPLSIMKKTAPHCSSSDFEWQTVHTQFSPAQKSTTPWNYTDKAMKFPKKVLGSGVVIKVIVNMSFVNVGADKIDICPLSCTRSFHSQSCFPPLVWSSQVWTLCWTWKNSTSRSMSCSISA